MNWLQKFVNSGLAVVVLLAVIPVDAGQIELVPGVVVEEETVYMMNPDGAVDAVAIASGEVLWSSTAAAKPLVGDQDLLACQVDEPAQSGMLEVVLLDRRTGMVRETMSLDLPTQVWAEVDERLGRSFTVRGAALDDEVFLAWEHRRTRTSGLEPRPGEIEQETLDGAYRIDLAANVYEVTDLAAVEADPMGSVPDSVLASLNQQEPGDVVVHTGETVAAIGFVIRDGQQQMVLKRWNPETGEQLDEVDLVSGSHILELVSADRKHLLVSQRVAAGAWDEYRWTIFSLDTGQRLGAVGNHFSHARFFVHDSVLVYEASAYGRNLGGAWIEEPRRVRAVRLAGGTEVWEHPLRDTTFRGPFPP